MKKIKPEYRAFQVPNIVHHKHKQYENGGEAPRSQQAVLGVIHI